VDHQDWLTMVAQKDRDELRFSHWIPNYLAPILDEYPGASICSIGCGTGADVALLRQRGYDAWGFSPTRTEVFGAHGRDVAPYLAKGTAQERPFGDRQFNIAYALEVIEHVGCRNFGTEITETTTQERESFLDACLRIVKPGGFLMLTSSNRLCPLDFGHRHPYTAVGRLAGKFGRLGVTWPTHPGNFLVSIGDIRHIYERSTFAGTLTYEALPVAHYPSLTSKSTLAGRFANLTFLLLNARFLRASPLCPIFVLKISRSPVLPRQD
jgi:SAM-dependent methyltransferase